MNRVLPAEVRMTLRHFKCCLRPLAHPLQSKRQSRVPKGEI